MLSRMPTRRYSAAPQPMQTKRYGVHRRPWIFAVTAALLAVVLAVACNEDEDRCSHDSDCPNGKVCSNEYDQQGQGVCLAICDKHINAPACDAGSASDAKSESSATTDGSAEDATSSEASTADATGSEASTADATSSDVSAEDATSSEASTADAPSLDVSAEDVVQADAPQGADQ